MGEEELLAQIRDLLDQYLALGSDTPVAPEAEALAAAIDQSAGGGYGEEGAADMASEPGGEPPPSQDQMPMMSGDTAIPDMTGGMPLDQQQPGNFSDFESARSALEGEMKKRIKGR